MQNLVISKIFYKKSDKYYFKIHTLIKSFRLFHYCSLRLINFMQFEMIVILKNCVILRNMKSNIVLEVDSLSISFYTKEIEAKVVDNVTFNLDKGEILGIVGESGSGKSITALSIIGLHPHGSQISAQSKINFNNDDNFREITNSKIRDLRNIRGRSISMIFQEPMTSLNPVQRCGLQVTEVLKIHNIGNRLSRKKKVLQLFEEVLLPNPEKIYKSFPHQLSGGQRQRVMIAMAIACEPQILIADEPTTALDVSVQKSILELILNLQKKKNMSVILISHDLAVISQICDRVLIMFRGKVLEEIASKKLYTDAKHPYTKGLIACRPSVNNRPEVLPTMSEFMNIESSFSEMSSNLIQRPQRQKVISNDLLFEIKGLSTYFPVRKSLLGNVKVWYKAVDNLNFEIFRGETLGLVGESGCGKTSLSRTILRLLEAYSGEIFFNGTNILKINKNELKKFRSKAQIIFQDPYSSLNPLMTIGMALVEVMKVHKILNNYKERKKYVIDILSKVGLQENDFEKYPHQFSGGQRQRIVIARALVVQPEFIICDEAVSALDVSVQAQVLNLLNQLKKEFNLTYLFITHDWSVVKYMSDRIIVMQKGKIVEMGEIDEVFYKPKSDYTKKLIDCIA